MQKHSSEYAHSKLQQTMKLQIDQQNYVIIDVDCGGRIIELALAGHLIIKAQKPYSDLGSGMFLMFPWVSKVPTHPYEPQLQNQYHGYVMNTPRQIRVKQKEQHKIEFELFQKQGHEDRHTFKQTYTISKGLLCISLQVLKNYKDKMPCCFGYHPYLQIDDHPLDTMKIKSDITTLLQFDENTLPIYPFKQRLIEITQKSTYNNLFKGGSFLQIISQQQTHLRISSNLPYWQIYNPKDRNRLAVEPVSFGGNLYNIYQQDPSIVLPNSGKIQLSVWQQ